MNDAFAFLRWPPLALLIVFLAACTYDREIDPASALREEAFDAVRASVDSTEFDSLPQHVMPTVGAVCGLVQINGVERRRYFYVRGQKVIVANDASSEAEVADRCRRALTEVEELKLLPTKP